MGLQISVSLSLVLVSWSDQRGLLPKVLAGKGIIKFPGLQARCTTVVVLQS